MGFIAQEDQDYLRGHFAKEMQGEVNIICFTQQESPLTAPGTECEYCGENRQILEELASLSDKIRLSVHDLVADEAIAKQYDVDKIPATIITGAANGRVRYFGIPSGYEFTSLIEDIVDVSKGTTNLAQTTLEELAKLSEPVNIKVFVTPT